MSLICPFSRFPAVMICLAFTSLSSGAALATEVTLTTPLGDVGVELFDEAAPETVANLLKYHWLVALFGCPPSLAIAMVPRVLEIPGSFITGESVGI